MSFLPSKIRNLSLSAKIVLLSCAVVFITATVIGGFFYWQINQKTLDATVEGLAGETRLIALQFKSGYDQMADDALIISKTPPIPGMARSTRNNDIDPLDQSTTEIWRTRLETIFISMMDTRPFYTQIRYIGIGDGGRELVRVNRSDDSYERVPAADLQQKGNETYFQEGLKLQQGEVFFSNITFNREHGKVDKNLTPTLRVVWPVCDTENKLFGFIVCNTDYPKLLRHIFENIRPDKEVYVINQQGDYLRYDPNTGIGEFEFHQTYTDTMPDFLASVIDSPPLEKVFLESGEVEYFKRLDLDAKSTRGQFLGITLVVPRDRFLAEVYKTRIYTIAITCGLIILTLLMTLILTRNVVRPLQKMTDAIVAYRGSDSALNLPVELTDEIGELARAFQEMTEDLVDSETRINAIVENAADGIVTIDERGRLERVNSACRKIFGYSDEEMTGMEFRQLLEKDLFPVSGAREETTGMRKDGTSFPLEVAFKEVDLENQKLFSCVLRDVTDRVQREQERERLIAQLSHSNEELDNFAHITSHDLKEPLRAIGNHCSFLLEDYKDVLDESGHNRLKRLIELVGRMEKLISDLHYFSQLGREESSVKQTDMNTVVEDVEFRLRDRLEETNSKLSTEGRLPEITCDTVRITEALHNLVSNAIKYNDSDQPEITIGFDKRENRFFVRDNGIGIAPEFHKDAFRIFKRLHGRKKYGEGSGSGLAFVERIVEKHGGKVWLDSDVGKGTSVYFTLN